MDFRQLGKSGLMVPALTLGTGTFGGTTPFFEAWGNTGVKEATRLVDICLDAGLTMFDTADVYSAGDAERILGKALGKRRNRALISTKVTFPMGSGKNEMGSSRYWLRRAVEAALQRLGTDHIDLLQLHGFDAVAPQEETLRALDDLVTAGKLLYIGASNFSGWHLMKSLATSDRLSLVRHVAHQAYYSLLGRDLEWELMPLALDQGVGTVVWSPLGWGRLSGKYRRSNPIGKDARASQNGDAAPPVADELLYKVMDALDAIAAETGKSVAQIALNWVLGRPSVSTVVIWARNDTQLKSNLGALGWQLTPDQIAKLDKASARPLAYPYWHQSGFKQRNPFPV
jgi:aryl-alcohol dehydrogenase-like predicted oxidoreductase